MSKPDKTITRKELERLTALRERDWEEFESAQRRLQSPKERLAWIIKFADTKLSDLSPAERDIEGYNLKALMTLGDRTFSPQSSPGPIEGQQLIKIQQEISRILRNLFPKNPWNFNTPAVWKLKPGKEMVVINSPLPPASLSPTPPKGTMRFQVSHRTGNERLAILHGLLRALIEGSEFLRTCTRCKKPFVATKRQEYCSTNCSQIVRNEKKKQIKEERRKKSKK